MFNKKYVIRNAEVETLPIQAVNRILGGIRTAYYIL